MRRRTLPPGPPVAEPRLTAEMEHLKVPPGAYGLADGETAIRTDSRGNQFRVTATRAAIKGGLGRRTRAKAPR